MGFNKRKMKAQHAAVAEKEAAAKRATEAHILEGNLLPFAFAVSVEGSSADYRVTSTPLGTKDIRRRVGANGTRKYDIRAEVPCVAPLAFPVLDIVPRDDGVVGRGAADRTYNEARREYAN